MERDDEASRPSSGATDYRTFFENSLEMLCTAGVDGYLKELNSSFERVLGYHGLGTDPDDSAIVTAVVRLGQALGLTVLAEGVETAVELERLLELGCDRAQGFRYARPMPSVDLAPLVSSVASGPGPV
ncbi:MAG: hypothetical protein NVSMB4_20530 [Acidimicrobiales bacterium]